MFTWREKLKKKHISPYYLNNIANLIKNDFLGKEMNKNNITLYLSLHRLIYKEYEKIFQTLSKKTTYIKLINQNEISECLSKTNLIVTDFSSIVFDIMYRRKPFIIYIQNSKDEKIKDIYTRDYYDLIESMNNGTIYFENIFFNINQTINKIIYYLHNNFTIETNLIKFYDSFQFKSGNNINKFINYLINLS